MPGAAIDLKFHQSAASRRLPRFPTGGVLPRIALRARALIVGVLVAMAATVAFPTPAAAACDGVTACLEATFPAAYAWPTLHPATAVHDSPEQFITVSSSQAWGVRIASDHADGRMREWNGSAYVTTTPKVLAGPLHWTLTSVDGAAQPISYRAVSSTPALVVTNQPTTCTSVCASAQIGVRYRQTVGFSDPPAGVNDYRIALQFEAAQGF